MLQFWCKQHTLLHCHAGGRKVVVTTIFFALGLPPVSGIVFRRGLTKNIFTAGGDVTAVRTVITLWANCRFIFQHWDVWSILGALNCMGLFFVTMGGGNRRTRRKSTQKSGGEFSNCTQKGTPSRWIEPRNAMGHEVTTGPPCRSG